MSKNASGSFTYANVTSETTGCFSTSSSGSIKTVGDYYRSIAKVSMHIEHTHQISGFTSEDTISIKSATQGGTNSYTGVSSGGTHGKLLGMNYIIKT